MYLQGNISMHLKVQFLIDIGNESQHQFRKRLHEERVIVIGIDAFLVFQMQLEQDLQVFGSEVGDYLEGLEFV